MRRYSEELFEALKVFRLLLLVPSEELQHAGR
jgi:hypothetical protein